MSEQAGTDFEALLRRALAPVEPPDDLAARLESTLTDAHRGRRRGARRLGALGDARPAQLGPAGRGRRDRDRRRGAALVVLRVRASQKRRHAQGRSPGQLAGRALRAALEDARRALRDCRRRAPRRRARRARR